MKVTKRKRATAAPAAKAEKEVVAAPAEAQSAVADAPLAAATADAANAESTAETAVLEVLTADSAAEDTPAPQEVPAAAGMVVTLASNCTVKDAAALKQSLCALVDAAEPVTLDARSLERIDTAAVQVLCAFVRQRAAAAHGVVWMGVPAALQEAARLLGVNELLALPPAGAAP